jgi:hypothetical protein
MKDYSKAHKEVIEVRKSGVHGHGVFALQMIPRGSRIIQYKGQKITNALGAERYDEESMDSHHTFLFSLDEEFCLDGGKYGNEAKYINHSCSPNCEAVQEGSKIFIDAIRTIRKGQELTFDYALCSDGELPENWEEFYACCCGSKNCRGVMLAPEEIADKAAAT